MTKWTNLKTSSGFRGKKGPRPITTKKNIPRHGNHIGSEDIFHRLLSVRTSCEGNWFLHFYPTICTLNQVSRPQAGESGLEDCSKLGLPSDAGTAACATERKPWCSDRPKLNGTLVPESTRLAKKFI